TSTTRNREPAAARIARASRAGTCTNWLPTALPFSQRPPAFITSPEEAPMQRGEGGTGRMDFPFVGIPSFLRSAICTDAGTLDADIAVLGAPTDEGSPFMPGSRFGPRSLREHSLRFVTDGRGYYDPEARKQYLEREMLGGPL